jgi:hypothetical protein
MNVPSEEGAELQRLYGEYTEGTARAAAALLAGDSQGFREEDDKVGLIVRRIREIFGTMRWSRLSEQFFRVDKWSVCRG